MNTLHDLLAEIDTWPRPIDPDKVSELVQRAWGIALGHRNFSPTLVDDEGYLDPYSWERRALRLEDALRQRGVPDEEIAQI